MLKWCSYCQKFIGEIPAYENLAITHGICKTCAPNAFALTKCDSAHTFLLRDVHDRLFAAGEKRDLRAAADIVDEAVEANISPVDILIGLIAPMLYQIGNEWERGKRSVAEEHRFTVFCENMFELIVGKTRAVTSAEAVIEDQADVLIMNAPGNFHTLGIRILALWLADKGLQVRVVESPISLEKLITLVCRIQPKLLLISMALAEQSSGVKAIAQCVAQLPVWIRPKIIVGGNAIKYGFSSVIPDAELIADIGVIQELCTSPIKRT